MATNAIPFQTCLLLLVALAAHVAHGQSDTDLDTVRQRVIASQFPSNASSDVPAVREWEASLKPDGSWPDIDYTNTDRANWLAAAHTARLLTMAVSWTDARCPLHADSGLLGKSLLALDYWLAKDYQNSNWWWNQIGIPLNIGPACLMLQASFPDNETAGCTRILSRANYTGWTGENTVWEGEGMLFNALLHNNATFAAEIFRHVFASIVVTNGSDDGIKVDGSFFQHGPQLMNGHYGGALATTMLKVIPWTTGTEFQPDAGTLQVFTDFLLRGSQPTILFPKGLWDLSVIGREITRQSCCLDGLTPSLITGLPATPNQAELLAAFADRLANPTTAAPLVGPVHYWKADYVAHRQPQWVATVKMYSKRTINGECGNSEGKKSLHLSDGVVWLYRTGAEWFNYVPALNWDQLPGTTVEQGLVPLTCATASQRGRTAFVGGVVDNGTTTDPRPLPVSVAAFDFRAALNGTVTGKKAYIWLGGVGFWLGAALRSTEAAAVVTTVAQQPVTSGVYANSAAGPPLPDGSHSFPTVPGETIWVHHGEVGYIVATSGANDTNPAAVDVSIGNQTGRWEDIGAFHGTVTARFVRIGLDHTHASRTAAGASYAVVVVPAVGLSDFAASAKAYAASVAVIANTGEQQAVVYDEGGVVAAVFYLAGTVSGAGWSVTVDRPCAVIATAVSASETRVVVSDPSQDEAVNEVSVTVTRKAEGVKAKGGQGEVLVVRQAVVALPQGEWRGSSVTNTLKHTTGQ